MGVTVWNYAKQQQCGPYQNEKPPIRKMTSVIISSLADKKSLRILVTRTDRMGDLVLTTPVFAAIRRQFPDCYLAALVMKQYVSILEGNPAIDEIIPYDKAGRQKKWWQNMLFALSLRKKKFDVVVNVHSTNRMHMLSFFAGIPVRAGYNSDARGLLLTHSVPLTRDIKKVHQVNYYREMVKALGCVSANRDMNLETKISREEAQNVLRRYVAPSQKMLIGIAPGATYGAAKKWFPDRFAETLNRLDEQFSVQGIILGGKADRITAEEVRTSARADMINLAGETSLREAIYLISQCRLFISNDSGLMHVAGALNVPTIAIFGSTNPTTTSPVGKQSLIVRKEVSCSPCLKKTCPTDFRCMNLITVEDVLSVAQTLLKDNRDKDQ